MMRRAAIQTLLAGLLFLSAPALGQGMDPHSVEEAITLIETRYADRVDTELLWRAATAGVAAGLDAQLGVQGSAVLSAEQHAAAQHWLDGERHGIGVEFSIHPGQGLLITDVFEGGPAQRGGVEIQDLIVAMDGHPFVGQPAAVIHTIVAQATGPEVVLEVRRGTDRLRRIAVTRGQYDISDVTVQPDPGDIPVLRVPFFGRGTSRALAKALQEQGDPRRPIVLDLRDNAGGRIEEVISAADLFLDPGFTIVILEGPDGRRTPQTAAGARTWTGEVIALTNPGTRGTAEAFLAALRRHGVARLVGTHTGGEDALSSFHVLDDDLVMKIPEQTMLDPTGSSWRRQGLIPDVMVEPVQSSMPPPSGTSIPDLQRDTALQMLTPR